MNFKTNILFFLLFSTFAITQAQTTRTSTTNTNSWLMYFGNHKFTQRIGLHAEIQLRRHDIIKNDQQFLLRTGLDIYMKNSDRFTIGYAFIKTYPYGEYAVPNPFPEHRIWQQYLTTQTLGKAKLAHRYRLEQRMIGNATTGKFENGRYENRFRYMAKFTRPISGGDHPFFIALYDEIFVNFGKDVAYNIFDQNRLYGAIGYTIAKNLKIEVGYLNQLVQLRSLDVIGRNQLENNHTLQIGFFSTSPFKAL